MAEAHGAAARGRKKWVFPDKNSPEGNKPVGTSEKDAKKKQAAPFRGHITGGMHPGKRVVVFGIVDSHPDRFYLGLTCGCGTSRGGRPDVALEICVQFKDRQVLRRAYVTGSWDDPVGDIPFFPFIRGQPFKMEIFCEHSRYLVLVDGQQLFGFGHRVTPLRDVDTLWIKGSVAVTKLA
ncbi:galectin-related protein-like [Antennarius striatus]|uniref:galectin-related protein-like n=1 Tax=Antennarius striatus TaxID=241820 RepID=UPI0035B3099D